MLGSRTVGLLNNVKEMVVGECSSDTDEICREKVGYLYLRSPLRSQRALCSNLIDPCSSNRSKIYQVTI